MGDEIYLIVNGDDFGVHHAANAGIIKAFTEGILTTASIITPTPWFAEAVMLAKEHGLPLGVELAISCEYDNYRFGPLTRAPQLSPDGKGYFFPKSPNTIQPRHAAQVSAEAVAQVERLVDAGIRPVYFHAHMGGIPRWDGAFSEAVHTLCDRFQVPWKVKSDTSSDAPMQLVINASSGLTRPTGFEEKKQLLLETLERMQPVINWLGSHPATDTEELRHAGLEQEWGAQVRSSDVQALCAPEVRRRVEELGIRLIDAGAAWEMRDDSMARPTHGELPK